MEDDRPLECRERCGRLGRRLPAVDHDREPELRRELELGVEEVPLLAGARMVVNVVEPRLEEHTAKRIADGGVLRAKPQREPAVE